MVNGFPTAVWKRLEALERAVRFRGPRMVVLTVPTGDDGARTPETETALIEIKRQHGVSDADDLVIEVARYGDDPESLPQLVSVSSQF
jgi:hypothetical protein